MAQIQLGSLTLQPHRQLLAGGQPVQLGRKALDILSVLANAGGALVTKDELLAAVWPGVIVEENALQVHVAALRKALGPEADRLITVRGLGYRLEISGPPVAESLDEGQGESLAVLPFVNLTGDPAKEYIADGLAVELIASLSHGSALRIPTWTSSHAYKNKDIDLRQIGRELCVNSVLEGEVQGGENRLRIHAQLIDVGTGFHRWSDTFDRHPRDLLELQDELALAISSALRAHLSPMRPLSASSEAFDLYLRARALENMPSHANISRAAEMYRQAIAIDAGFAGAHARLAAALCLGLAMGTFPPQALEDARGAAERAITLDPSLASGHAALASVCLNQGDWLQADAAHKRAAACASADAQALIAHGSFLATAGYLSQAREKFEGAAELEPTNTRAALTCASFHSFAGNHEACDRWVENATALGSSPDEVPVAQIRAKRALRNDEPVVAAQLWVKGLPQQVIETGLEDVSRQVFLVVARGEGGQQAMDALAAYWASAGVQEIVARSTPLTGIILTLHALLNDMDGAYRIAAHVARRLHTTGQLDESGARIVWTRMMEVVRYDPRFAGFMEELGLVAFWRRNGWPDLWSPEGLRPIADLVREWNAAS